MAPTTPDKSSLTPRDLLTTALAFRGYNVENLGRSCELLADERYRPIIVSHLEKSSAAASRWLERDVNLIEFLRAHREPTLAQYGESVALVMAMSSAQLECLQDVHDVPWKQAAVLLGYSLGEVSALVAGGALEQTEAMLAPLKLANDCVALAEGVQLAVFFSRKSSLDMERIDREILLTNLEQQGVMGVSAVLAPNSILLMGQGDTLKRFQARMREHTDERVYLRRNPHAWPPMHTPIVWQRNIPSRAAQLLLTMKGGLTAPEPSVLSLVTGKTYTATNVRDTLYRWTDQRQLLWAGVCDLFRRGIQTVIHVGPQPNIIPATLKRISDNVEAQTRGSIGMRTLAKLANRPWLKTMLPERTSLLLAPQLRQIILEDWLLEH